MRVIFKPVTVVKTKHTELVDCFHLFLDLLVLYLIFIFNFKHVGEHMVCEVGENIMFLQQRFTDVVNNKVMAKRQLNFPFEPKM